MIFIDFTYTNADDEVSFYIAVKKVINENFKDEGGYLPKIIFNANEVSERKLFLKNLKNFVTEMSLSDWMLRHLNIHLTIQDIRLQKIIGTNIKDEGHCNASIFLEKPSDGLKLIMFNSEPKNVEPINLIF